MTYQESLTSANIILKWLKHSIYFTAEEFEQMANLLEGLFQKKAYETIDALYRRMSFFADDKAEGYSLQECLERTGLNL